jgi:hypothetical protein
MKKSRKDEVVENVQGLSDDELFDAAQSLTYGNMIPWHIVAVAHELARRLKERSK